MGSYMTNSRRKGDSPLFISFCNVREGRHSRENRLAVAAIDCSTNMPGSGRSRSKMGRT
jgi:hypothetical protein